MTRLLGISGSLRSQSYNTALLRAAQRVAGEGVELEIATLQIELPCAETRCQLQGDLQACLDEGDRLLADSPLTIESYVAYAAMNDRFHALILAACGNRALQRAVAINDKLPFAPASAMLPMQGTVALDRDWMLYAHRQHHMLFDALKRGEGARAQAAGDVRPQLDALFCGRGAQRLRIGIPWSATAFN